MLNSQHHVFNGVEAWPGHPFQCLIHSNECCFMHLVGLASQSGEILPSRNLARGPWWSLRHGTMSSSACCYPKVGEDWLSFTSNSATSQMKQPKTTRERWGQRLHGWQGFFVKKDSPTRGRVLCICQKHMQYDFVVFLPSLFSWVQTLF